MGGWPEAPAAGNTAEPRGVPAGARRSGASSVAGGFGGAWVAPGSCVCLRAATGAGRPAEPEWGPQVGAGGGEQELECSLEWLLGGSPRGVRCSSDAEALSLAAALEAENSSLEDTLARPLSGGGGAAAPLGRRLLVALREGGVVDRRPHPLLRWLLRREAARCDAVPDFRRLGTEFREWYYLSWPSGSTSGTGVAACHGRFLHWRVLRASPEPRLAYVEGFVGADEAAHLVKLGRGPLHPSRVVARERPPGTGAPEALGGVQVAERTSHNGLLPKSDPVVREVVQRAAFLTGLMPSHAEAVQVVRYRPGEEYREHCDWFDPKGPQYAAKAALGGQRLVSVFCYLQGCFRGGETAFPRLGVRFLPRCGGAVVWYNLDEAGREDPRTLHSGCPVIEGEKWGMNIWLRARPRRERTGSPSAQPLPGINFASASPGGSEYNIIDIK